MEVVASRVDAVVGKLLAAGAIVGLLGATAWSLGFRTLIAGIVLLVGGSLFIGGFVIWSWSTSRRFWGHPAGKAFLWLVNIVVLWLTSVFVQAVVAAAIGLPPLLFESTTRLFTLILYVPAALLVTCLILSVTSGFLYLAALLSDDRSFRYLGLMIGAFLLAVLCAAAVDGITQNEARLYPLARYVAAHTDFQPASLHPGVPSGERVVFLGDGLFALARPGDYDAAIVVRRLEE